LECVGADERAGDGHLAQQCCELRDLVGFFWDCDLRDDAFVLDAEGTEEVEAALLAFDRLAVDGEVRVRGAGAEEPRAEELVEPGGVDEAERAL